jgi:hypothetical protein
MNDKDVAIEELKILQTIIHNQDIIFSRIRGWCVVVVGGISIGLLSDKIQIPNAPYLAISTLIVFTFTWTEAIHRVAQKRAMTRSGDVESFLRGEREYDGPLIRNSLNKTNRFKDQIGTFSNRRFIGFYFAILFIPVFIGFWA